MDKRMRARITAGGAGLILLAGLGACAVRTGGSAGNYTYVLGDPRQSGLAGLGIGSAPTAPFEMPLGAAVPAETGPAEMVPAQTSAAETAPESVAPGVPDGTPPVSQGPLVTASVVDPQAGTITGSAFTSKGVTYSGAAISGSVPKPESTTVEGPPALAPSMVDGAETPPADAIAYAVSDLAVSDFASEMPDATGELRAAPPAVTAVTAASSTAVATMASAAPSGAAAPAATATVSKPTTLAVVATTITSINSGGGGGGSGDGGLGDVAEFNPAATPELGSLALFGSGAAGMGSYLLARLRRRR